MIQILTDSTADLPPDVAVQEGILVVPAQVTLGEQTFREGIDLTSEHLFRFLREGSDLPKTSLPRGHDFQATYHEALERGATAILAIHIGSHFSGLLNASRLYAEQVPLPVEVIDSGTASMALGWLAIYAARRARAGLSLKALAEEVRAAAERATLFAMLDTLEFARRGGRVGRLTHFVADRLGIKPIVTVAQNAVTLVGRTRSHRQALRWLAREVERRAPHFGVAVLHADAPSLAEQLTTKIQPYLDEQTLFVTRPAGAVLSAHAGPGAVGVAFLQEAHEQA